MLKLGVLILKWPKSQILHIPYPYFMRLKCFLGWVLSFTTIKWFATWPVLELPLQMDANLSLGVLIKCALIKEKKCTRVGVKYWKFEELLPHYKTVIDLHVFNIMTIHDISPPISRYLSMLQPFFKIFELKIFIQEILDESRNFKLTPRYWQNFGQSTEQYHTFLYISNLWRAWAPKVARI